MAELYCNGDSKQKPPPRGEGSFWAIPLVESQLFAGESALCGRSRSTVFFGVLAAEALDPAGRVHQLLFAGKERMAR